jgi:hypothetical protein
MRNRILFNQVKSFRLRILLIVFSGLCANASFSQSVWVGGISGTANDTLASVSTNWNPVGTPTAASDVIIPDGTPPLYIDVNTTCASITFQSGSLLTRIGVAPGITLTVTGNIIIEAATAPRAVITLGTISCAAIVCGINSGPLPGNIIGVVINGSLTVPGDVTGCNVAMNGNSTATFGGNLTGGEVFAPFNIVAPTIDFNSTDPQTVQGGVYGIVKFSGGGDKTVVGAITVSTEIDFINGIVLNSLPIFLDGSLGGQPTSDPGNPLSFAAGPMRRLAPGFAGRLSFPVGKKVGGFHPASITTAAVGGDFTVEYIRSSGAALGPITAAGILTVSSCEYWDIIRNTGTNSADVELTWSPTSSCGGGGYISLLSALRVAHFDGTNWNEAGGTGGTGDPSSGSVEWAGVTNFSPFTIASTSLLNPLPVKFGSIKAYEKQNGIQLDWKVYSENKVKSYEVERSADARTFTTVGSLPALYNNTSDGGYGFFDANPLAGTSHYRIKNNDLDGKSSYSIVIRVNRNKTIKGLNLYPNPVINGIVLLQGSDLGRGNYKINIFGANGQEMYKQQIKHNGGTISHTIELPLTLSKGVYMLSVKDENGNIIFKEKLVKQ